jgi:hypothetical protein
LTYREQTRSFRTLGPEMQPEPISNECTLCGGACHDERVLVNGESLHESCYANLLKEAEQARTAAGFYAARSAEIVRELARADSIGAKFRSWLSGRAIDKEALRNEQQSALARSNEHRYTQQSLEYALSELYDYWPTYPPDWDLRRRKLVEARGRSCSRCGRQKGDMHAHHRVPVSKGGHHKPDNLELLCSKCHSRRHGGADFSGPFEHDLEDSGFAERLRLIQTAMTTGRCISFRYRKFTGERSTRTIRPYELKQVGQSLCVRGLCYLRNDARIFAIKRMSNVQLD